MTDLCMSIIRKFVSIGYIVQIFPHPNGVSVMATKFGVQGAHYSSSTLDESIIELHKHMKENDKSLEIE